uniref:NAA35-like TPR repeats domain-containing protein n=1 Tax=Strombidium rassoulzadegani TaxID=1082188 RepID=A0A7S3FWB4_9SPIT|mmetsp:Transcript_7510/g.12684  ORF Transcript_7510/g.12684 Transcript_7510/m.12684 type:complete len:191 (+) Transcript_7510:405-977(+)
MTPIQKQMVDEFEFFKGLEKVYKGLQILCHALTEDQVITDPVAQYDSFEPKLKVRENIYNQRIKMFQNVQFPRLKTYEDYISEFDSKVVKKHEGNLEGIYSEAKDLIMQGRQILNNLQQTETSLRNPSFFSNEELLEIQKIAVTNSLIMAQVKMMRKAEEGVQLGIQIETAEPKNKYVPLLKLVKKPKRN